MSAINYLALLVPAAFYIAAGAAVIWRMRADGPAWPVHVLAVVALTLHAVVLGREMLAAHSVVIDVGGALSLFAWQSAILLLLFSLWQPIVFLGAIVYPITAVCLLIGHGLPAGNTPIEPLGWALQAHITLSLLAYGLLTLGALIALIMAIQHRALHEQRPNGLAAALPPLQQMEIMLFRLMAGGFFVLTLAIVSGLAFVDHLFAQHLAHKTILSILAWLVFGILLWGRHQFGWRGRAATRWSLGGYGLLILAYFGSKLVLELILGRHW